MENIYKEVLQSAIEAKFEEELENSNLPQIVKNYFIELDSANSKRNYLIAIDECLTWMVNKNIIPVEDVSQITLEMLGNLTRNNFIGFLRYYSQSHKKSTVEQIRLRLSAFCSYLERETNGRFYNPCKGIKNFKDKNKKGNKKIKLPDSEVVKRLLENSDTMSKGYFMKVRNRAIISLLIGSGLRINELVCLNKRDLHIDENNPYLETVRKGCYDEDDSDEVYLNGSCVNPINEYLNYLDTHEITSDDDALFINNRGERLQIRAVQDLIKKFSDGAVTPHMLRHYYITELYAKTKDLSFVQDNAGHVEGSNVTLGSYVNTIDKNLDMLKAI